MLSEKNIYSFDENSIINQCSLKIAPAFRIFFGNKEELKSKHYKQLIQLVNQLRDNNIKKYKFIPSRFELHVMEYVNKKITDEAGLLIRTAYASTLKASFIDQFEKFIKSLDSEFQNIEKNNDYSAIKKLFIDNEIELKKAENIPEDDDCKILRGLELFSCSEKKYIISEDEHFWRYADVILNDLGIQVIPEWECHNLCK